MAPNLASKFKLEVNASAIGAAIDYPVCYFSHTFNNHPVNYVTIEKEALALFMALQYFDVYFGSSNYSVVLFTDHNTLVFLSYIYNQNQHLMRWSLILQGIIKHKKGVENVIADALSRV